MRTDYYVNEVMPTTPFDAGRGAYGPLRFTFYAWLVNEAVHSRNDSPDEPAQAHIYDSDAYVMRH